MFPHFVIVIDLILLLLLPTATVQFSPDYYKWNVSDEVVSRIGTLFSLDQKLYILIPTPTLLLVKTSHNYAGLDSASLWLKQISSMACTNQKHYQMWVVTTCHKYQYPHQFFRHHFMGKWLFSIRLQLSKERLICFFFLIFRQTTAQLHAIILMTFKILCVPLPLRGPNAIHYVAQVKLMSNILVAHQLIKCCSEVAKNLFQCFYYLEMLL